ncbi:MAG: hypothetical protein WC465_03895 [Patescibacteria group bacterium]
MIFSGTFIWIGPKETLDLERAISELALYLFKDGCRHLKAEPMGVFSLEYREVSYTSPVSRGFQLEFKRLYGMTDEFETSGKYRALSGIDRLTILGIVAERIRQLAAVRGYSVEVGTKTEDGYQQLTLTTKELGL